MNDSLTKSQNKHYNINGLTSTQANKGLEKYGENIFTKEKTTILQTFLKQFLDPISLILIVSALLSIFMGEYSDASVILFIVILNSILSFIQEFRSGKSIEKLSELIDRKASVIRDGNQTIISVNKLVPGDIVILHAGDIVPADIKIIKSNNLSINESQLTGESIPVNKNENLKQSNLLFSGSIIEKGKCTGIVISTGNQTKLGRIAILSKHTKKQTPHEKSLKEFSLSILKMMGATIIFILATKIITIESSKEFIELILFTIALSMTVLPEALPMITTINLSSGALKLAKQNVLVKRLSAIENLGRMNLLCTDKTGTLTEDKLSVVNVISEDKELFNLFSYISIEEFSIKSKIFRSSFDDAFLRYSYKYNLKNSNEWIQLQNLPFDPESRRRRIIVKNTLDNKTYLVVLGSPETLLTLSTNSLEINYKEKIISSGKDGLRQLGIAYKEIVYTDNFNIIENENNLNFLGFANLHDPLRKDAKKTISKAKELGINIKILTGDSIEVAFSVAKDLGLIKDNDIIYSGDELDLMNEDELNIVLERCSVFAKVTPEQKYKIIKHLKKNYVVGYQGDGINDAPSLKLADVSMAVHNATDVAKESADIVILENNLNVIIDGIHYGRSIYANINKYIKHAMIGNIGSFFALVFFYIIFAADLPMLPIQLLIANLIQDMPLMMVFTDSVNEDELTNPQAKNQMQSVMKTSLTLGIFTAIYYFIYLMFIGIEANAITRTTLFLFFNFTQLMIILCVRNKDFLWMGKKPSKALTISILIFILLSIFMVYIPNLSSILGFVPLPASNFISLVVISIGFILLLDIAKVLVYKLQEHRLKSLKINIL